MAVTHRRSDRCSKTESATVIMSSRLVWYLLIDYSSGKPYRRTSADCVSLFPGVVVAQFRDAVKAKNSNKLSSFDASDLFVYRNKADFDKRNAVDDDEKDEQLRPTDYVDGSLGSSEDMLVVAVPSSAAAASTGKWNWSCIKIWQHVSYIRWRDCQLGRQLVSLRGKISLML
jgi:hypothetical protein